MNELSTDLQEKASMLINEVSKYTSPFGEFYSELVNNISWIKVCFAGCGVVKCSMLAMEALELEENIPKLVRFVVRDVLSETVLRHLKYSDEM